MEFGTPKSAAVLTDPRSESRGPARRVVRAEDLTEAEIKAISESRMDPRHDYLDELMEELQ